MDRGGYGEVKHAELEYYRLHPDAERPTAGRELQEFAAEIAERMRAKANAGPPKRRRGSGCSYLRLLEPVPPPTDDESRS
jgi:hypothetical protein